MGWDDEEEGERHVVERGGNKRIASREEGEYDVSREVYVKLFVC